MQTIFKAILAVPRAVKRIILITVDTISIISGIWVSFSLRLDDWYWPQGGLDNPIILLVLFAPVIAVPVFAYFGLYRAIVRYLGMRAVWSILKAVILYAVIWGLVTFLSGVQGVPISIMLINAMVALLIVGGSRMFARLLLSTVDNTDRIRFEAIRSGAGMSHQTRVVIFGAGAAGRQLAVGLTQSRECVLKAFVDDRVELQGRDLIGVPIISQKKLKAFVVKHQIDDILLAIPSITPKQRSKILERLRPLNIRIRTVPGLMAMAQGKTSYSDLLDLDINDLLGREAAEPDEEMLQEQVTAKVIMVTGAGGSIGSELCRQIMQRKPKILILFELSEFSLYSLHNELINILNSLMSKGHNSNTVDFVPIVIPLLGTVSDENRLSDIIKIWKPNIIYHAAAIKHVPVVEHNIAECIKNNVLGTLIVSKLAIQHQIEQVVLVSTDKAVNPTNAMGASKRCCELILQALAAEESPLFDSMWPRMPSVQVSNNTKLAIVRFGNVLGSSGSVVPYFRQQIAQGGPITLTHPDIIRYFMTIPEAAQLVMQTGAMAGDQSKDIAGGSDDVCNYMGRSGAEVYVLDMGDPIKIKDLVYKMVELSGLRIKNENSPEGDIAIDVIGLRPGEKLYEELLIGNNTQATQHPRIMKANEKFLPWDELQPMITKLYIAAMNGDVVMIRSMLQKLVPEYQPDEKIVDWVYRAQVTKSGKL